MAKNTKELAAQPQAIEAEQAVLGSMLISKDAVSKSLQWLPASTYFYKDAHAKIFSCMIDLFDRGDPIDSISVVDQLKKKKELKSVGGVYYITGLSESVPTTANVEHYAKIVLEKYILRNLIEVSQEVTKNAFDDSQYVGDILDDAESRIFNITEKRLRGEGFSHIDPILHRTFEELDKIASKPGSVTGVASGLMDLDDITSGFHSGELIIVAGRPGMGKTALALTMGRNAAVLDQIVVTSAYQLSQIFDHFVVVTPIARDPDFADGSPCRQLTRAGAGASFGNPKHRRHFIQRQRFCG